MFGLSIIKHVTLQKRFAHDFRYDPRTNIRTRAVSLQQSSKYRKSEGSTPSQKHAGQNKMSGG